MVHTNSDSAKREKEAVTFAIRVRTMWYEEKVSNFEIAVLQISFQLPLFTKIGDFLCHPETRDVDEGRG